MGGSWPADRSRCAQPSQVGFRPRRPPDPGTYAFAVISSTLEYVKRLVLLANRLLLLTDLTTHFLMLPAHLVQYECAGEYIAKIQ